MITNLFSIFDPSSAYISISWTTIFLPIIIILTKTSNLSSSTTAIVENINSTIETETKHLITNSNNGTTNIITTIFITLIIMNIIALIPQTFANTTSLDINLVLAIIMWITSILFGTITNTNNIIVHLVPQGTPTPLINFMVIIEITSNLIRPITLCIRLTANIVAGHLLLSLLSGMITSIAMTTQLTLIIIPITLTILETAVAVIQAYVFTTLITLYTAENQ